MSDETTSHSDASATLTAEVPFDRAELQQFGADDVEAGRNICKMLSLFFFYTVIVMGLSTYVTWKWVTGE